MDIYAFYTGKDFKAYQWLGAHLTENGAVFRVFAPHAESVGLIGDFKHWTETVMEKVSDGKFYECIIPEAQEGMRYKLRIHEKNGRFLDRSDPYGFGTELRPQNASIIRRLDNYKFNDGKWMRYRTVGFNKPVNIYELHLGSWKNNPNSVDGLYTYRSIAKPLISYAKDMGYNYIELMPICEYPCDTSWGYQAVGYYSPTARYGEADDLKYLIDQCHQNSIGVILDFSLVHFAVDDFGLSEFDGTPLFEYPHKDIAYNEWGSKNFNHTKGEVQSFLQSAAMYWLEVFHFDGIRMDAVRNILYWQGDTSRGINQGAISFLKSMNEGIKKRCPNAMLIAEDSSAFPNVTKAVSEGGLGFDYKWDMGWMNDTLAYFKENAVDRLRDYHKLTFSMHYFYNEKFIMPLSHDEVVHGKATILQKMNGQYEDKFPQARALYLYMFAHAGKKLNFMGNENGQLREWDEKREQDWNILSYPIHERFRCFMKELNYLYLSAPALYEKDYERAGFEWIDCREGNCMYAFLRKCKKQTILAVFNFSDGICRDYNVKLKYYTTAKILIDSDWECFGGTSRDVKNNELKITKGTLKLDMERFSGKLFLLSRRNKQHKKKHK